MKRIDELNEMEIKGKTVGLRCDLNITISKDGTIDKEAELKLRKSLKTIEWLSSKSAKVVIMSHLNRIESEEDKEKNSLYPIYERMAQVLNCNVKFSPDTHGEALESKIKDLNPGEVLVMQNIRFEDLDNKKESKNDLEWAKYLASLFDIFVDDAFGMSHRKQASNNGIVNFIPRYFGFLIFEETQKLDILHNPEKPFIVQMGGAKIDDKLILIANILEKCDYLLITGGIANTFLSLDYNIGKSISSTDVEILKQVKDLWNIYQNKIIRPVDVIVENGGIVSIKKVNEVTDEDKICDLGPDSVELYEGIIKTAKVGFINGVAGIVEDERFEEGTRGLLKAWSKCQGKVIIGGGDAVASLRLVDGDPDFDADKIYHTSTGGGATLEYMGTGKLSCMEVKSANSLKP